MKKSWLKRKATNPLKRTKLNVAGHSTSAMLKVEIQALLREIIIIIDDGCFLRDYPEAGLCSGFRKDGELILQAEHLITRSNTATFGDLRNIVCLCRHHHGHFKPKQGQLYWDLVRKHIGEKRWKWLQLAQADKSPHKVDLKLVKVVLEQDLRTLKVDQ